MGEELSACFSLSLSRCQRRLYPASHRRCALVLRADESVERKLQGTFSFFLVIAHSPMTSADVSGGPLPPFYNCFRSAETGTFPAAFVFLACAISPRALRPVRTLVAAIAAK